MEKLSGNVKGDDKKVDIKNIKMDDQNIKGMEDMLENSSIGKIAKEVQKNLILNQ